MIHQRKFKTPRGLGRLAPAGSGRARGVGVVVGVGGVGFFGRRLRKGGAAGSGLGGCPPECRGGCLMVSWGETARLARDLKLFFDRP